MFTVLFSIAGIFKCTHDAGSDTDLRRAPPVPLDLNLSKFRTSNRESIRVKINLDAVGYPSLDPNSCSQSDAEAKVKKCRLDDVINPDGEKDSVIRQTFESVKSYIESLVNVTRYPHALNPSSAFSRVPSTLPTVVDDCDLYIVVVVRPFGADSSTLATAVGRGDVGNEFPEDFGRPLYGLVTVNAAKLPARPQNKSTGARQFWVTVVHELMHVLAFSAGVFPKWMNRDTGLKYPVTAVSYRNAYGMDQRFLVTPRLQKWVMERFEVLDSELVQLGLELEDGGGSGTAGSHPNSRLYFTDVMQGMTYGPGWISPIFANSLWDSGWYDVNESQTESLIYMDARMHGVQPNPNVLIQPAPISFPEAIKCQKISSYYCFYDHSAKGSCDLVRAGDLPVNLSTWDNPSLDDNFLLSKAELLDYAPVLLPWAICQNPYAPEEDPDVVGSLQPKLHETYHPDSVCALSTIFNGDFGELVLDALPACFQAMCDTAGRLYMQLDDGRMQLCPREGRKIYSTKHIGHVKCPPPAVVCANHNAFPVIPIVQAVPDRGPYDGQNFVMLMGVGLSKYTNLSITIGGEPMQILLQTNSSILVKFDRLPEANKEKTMEPQALHARDDVSAPGVTGDVEEFYTFVARRYEAGWTMATPAAVLLAMGWVAAFFI